MPVADSQVLQALFANILDTIFSAAPAEDGTPSEETQARVDRLLEAAEGPRLKALTQSLAGVSGLGGGASLSLLRMASAEWARYDGPHEGHGWKSLLTGRVVYQKEMPGEHQHESADRKPTVGARVRTAASTAATLTGTARDRKAAVVALRTIGEAGIGGMLGTAKAAWMLPDKAEHVVMPYAEAVAHATAAWAKTRFGTDPDFVGPPERLRPAVRTLIGAAKGLWFLLRLGAKGLFATWTASEALAEQVAKERGASEAEAVAFRHVLMMSDAKIFKAAAAVLHVTGGEALELPLSFIPVASLSYLAYSAARDPVAVFHASRKAVKKVWTGVRKAVHLSTTNARADLEPVFDAIQARHGDDWYTALLMAAFDLTHDMGEAVKVADTAWDEQPRMHRLATPTWTRYEGPEGGKGWKSAITGQVRYQEIIPGEDEHEPEQSMREQRTINDMTEQEVFAHVNGHVAERPERLLFSLPVRRKTEDAVVRVLRAAGVDPSFDFGLKQAQTNVYDESGRVRAFIVPHGESTVLVVSRGKQGRTVSTPISLSHLDSPEGAYRIRRALGQVVSREAREAFEPAPSADRALERANMASQGLSTMADEDLPWEDIESPHSTRAKIVALADVVETPPQGHTLANRLADVRSLRATLEEAVLPNDRKTLAPQKRTLASLDRSAARIETGLIEAISYYGEKTTDSPLESGPGRLSTLLDDDDPDASTDTADPDAAAILDRVLTAFQELADTAREDLLAAVRYGSAAERLRRAQTVIERHEPELAGVLTQAHLAALLAGMRKVLDYLPEPTPDEREEADATPPPVIDVTSADDTVHLPVIEEAVRDLASRRLLTPEDYAGLKQSARAQAFTVAGVESEATLAKIRDALAETVAEGASLPDFVQRVEEAVGAGTMLSEGTAETVFRTAVQSALSAGLDKVLSHPAIAGGFPYEQTCPIHDSRLTDLCATVSRSGIGGSAIFRSDDPTWQRLKPPRHFNCRCSRLPMSIEQAAAHGVEEARRWLESGVPPERPAWVPMPAVELPEGWTPGAVGLSLLRLAWVRQPGPRSKNRWYNEETQRVVYQATEPGSTRKRVAEAGAAGRTSTSELTEALAGHTSHDLDVKGKRSAESAWRMLKAHHGEHALTRLGELLRADVADLAKGKTHTRQGVSLLARVAGYRHVLELAAKEPHAAPAAPVTPPKTGVQTVALDTLKVDPHRFQYKLGMGSGGAGEELRSLRKFDPHLGGVLLVWHDPKDGQDYVVNGHHRYELAKRTNHPEMAVRYVEAPSAERARSIGALVNIAEGRGTPVDAAKFFRDTGLTADDLEQKHGVSLKGKVARDGMALARLDAGIFHAVTQGELDVEQAIAIGQELENPADQRVLFQVAKAAEERGRDLSPKVLREMAKEIREAPRETHEEQDVLFKSDVTEQNLFIERNEIKSAIRAQLEADRKLFASVGRKEKAAKLEGAGNVLDVDENRRIALETARVLHTFESLVNRKGPLADLITEAAKGASGASRARKRIIEGLYPRIREAVLSEIERPSLGAGAGAGEGHPEGDTEAGTRDEPRASTQSLALEQVEVGQTFDIPPHGNRTGFRAHVAEVKDGMARVDYTDSSAHLGGGSWMPVASVKHFVNDLSGKVDVPPNSGDPAVDAVTSGKAEFLGKGDDGLAFRTGSDVVKVSTTVPFQPFNPGHRSPEDAAARLHQQADVNNHLHDIGVPGVLRQRVVKHGDKAFVIRPALEIPVRLTPEQLSRVRQTIDTIHDKGYVVGDDIQVGLLHSEPYLFDLGKAQRSRHPEDVQDDSDHFERFAERMGGESLPLKQHAQRLFDNWRETNEFMPPEESLEYGEKLRRALLASGADPATVNRQFEEVATVLLTSLAPVEPASEADRQATQFAAIPPGEAGHVAGWFVRRTGPDHYRVETDRGHVEGSAATVAAHIKQQNDLAHKLDARRIAAARERVAAVPRNDQASSGALFGDEDLAGAEAFNALPDGTDVLVTEGNSAGRTGKLVRDETGRLLLKLDGSPERIPVRHSAVEPLDPKLSWRVPPSEKQREPTPEQQAFLSLERLGWGPAGETRTGNPRWRNDETGEVRYQPKMPGAGHASRSIVTGETAAVAGKQPEAPVPARQHIAERIKADEHSREVLAVALAADIDNHDYWVSEVAKYDKAAWEALQRGDEEYAAKAKEALAKAKRYVEVCKEAARDKLAKAIVPEQLHTIQASNFLSGQIENQANFGLRWLNQIVARREGDPDLPKVIFSKTSRGERAHFMSASYPRVALGRKDDDGVAVHELGHYLENHLPGVRRLATEFLRHRVGDESLTPMRKAAPGAGDGGDEVGRKDNFDRYFGEPAHSYYVGKHYESGDTEIVSMGIEALYRDPINFARKDPEYACFIVGILTGEAARMIARLTLPDSTIAELNDEGVWESENTSLAGLLQMSFDPCRAPFAGPSAGAFGRLAAIRAAEKLEAKLEMGEEPPTTPGAVY